MFHPTAIAPYYAVIFYNQRSAADPEGYARAAARMVELAQARPGYLGHESVRNADGLGLTVSYWQTLDDVKAWRADTAHEAARDAGRAHWYTGYTVRVARVERAYGWTADDGPQDPAPLAP